MAHVILFEHQYLFGAHKHVFESNPSLYRATQGDDFDMNDKTSSLVVLEGDWEFFADPNFENQLGGTVGPGVYSSITDALGGGSNDKITSLRPVDSGGSSLSSLLSNIKSEIIKVEEIIERPKHGR
jgi:hypothetical protein